MDDSQRFPIGKFVPAQGHDRALLETQITAIEALPGQLRAAASGLDDAQLDTPYRDGGWTVRQVVHHVADSHIHASVRTRLALTVDEPHIDGYNQDSWVALTDARTLPIEPSLQIIEGLHQRWATLLRSLDEVAWQRTYYHNEYRNLWPLWQVVGLYSWHGRHHTAHITSLRQSRGW